MGLRLRRLLLASFVSLAGCGTFQNLAAPPTPTAPCPEWGPTACEPFGGVRRSFVNGGVLLMGGPLCWPLSAAAVVVDAPLSLASDVVTLPVVLARRSGARWATWWGRDQERTATVPPTSGPPDRQRQAASDASSPRSQPPTSPAELPGPANP